MTSKSVYYVWDENLVEQSNRLPAVPDRASMVHGLIAAYGLPQIMKVVRSKPAAEVDLKKFHSDVYIEYLKKFLEVDDEYMATKEDEEYGIGYDCPPVSNLSVLVSTIAGGSITAARCLTLGLTNLVINWCGGWHHANRHGAEGFCYINDIVIAIECLREKFPKVLYIDLDVHHGNGVQDAYNSSKSVYTLSIHKYEPGFYPGTGDIDDVGKLVGKGYSCNVPLHAFYSDASLKKVFGRVFASIFDSFLPDAIVVQCGADALAQDPNGGASVTASGYCACVDKILAKGKPTMLLGGGGYKHTNAARLWAAITALAVGVTLDENIPEHNYWPEYGPDFRLAIQPTLSRDVNKESYLEDCIAKITSNLNNYLRKDEQTDDDKGAQRDSQPIERMNCHTRKLYQRNKNHNLPVDNTQSMDDVYAFTE